MTPIRYAMFATVACLALAGCDKKTTTVTTTANGTATVSGDDMSAAAMGIQPGKWQTIVQISDFKMKGVAAPSGPPAPAMTSCLTPEQAKKGPAEMLQNAKADCTATRSISAGGKIDVDMTCKLPTGTMSMKSTGTYTATTMSSDTVVSTTGPNAMSQKVHTEAKRIGECSG